MYPTKHAKNKRTEAEACKDASAEAIEKNTKHLDHEQKMHDLNMALLQPTTVRILLQLC